MPSIVTCVIYVSVSVFNAPESYKQLLAILPTNTIFSCRPLFLMSFVKSQRVLSYNPSETQPIPFITMTHFKNNVLQHLPRGITRP